MREITQEEIDEKVKAHKLWWDTNGEQGRRAIFRNVLIAEKKLPIKIYVGHYLKMWGANIRISAEQIYLLRGLKM